MPIGTADENRQIYPEANQIRQRRRPSSQADFWRSSQEPQIGVAVSDPFAAILKYNDFMGPRKSLESWILRTITPEIPCPMI